MGPSLSARPGVPGREIRNPRVQELGERAEAPEEETKPGRSPWAAGNRKQVCGEAKCWENMPATAPGGEVTPGTGQAAQRVPSLNEPRSRMGTGSTAPYTIHATLTCSHTRRITYAMHTPAPTERTRAVHAPFPAAPRQAGRAPLRRRLPSRPSHTSSPRGSAPGAAKTGAASEPAHRSQLPSESGELRRGWAGAQAP